MWSRYRDEDLPSSHVTASLELELDGERFAVEVSVTDETGYTSTSYSWLSGPNEGYGFALGGRPDPSLDDHRRAIRQFLTMVDPVTGFIEDE